MYFKHISVLTKKVIDFAPESTKTILDCTLGGGGHSQILLERFPEAKLFGIDRDLHALKASKIRLKSFKEKTTLAQATFSELPDFFLRWGYPFFDYILADIGVSSEQLSRPLRGFSFLHEGPLDMRMDKERQKLTAAHIVNNSNEQDLLKILRSYGEERFARRIVSAILVEREKKPLETTKELADLVKDVIPIRLKKPGINQATLTFQALRIAVNDELNELTRLLEQVPKRLHPNGRFAIISFHSLEDRMIKHQLRKWENPCECPTNLPYCICGKKSKGKVLTKIPVSASAKEVINNPRSRSAHLRVFSLSTKEVS